MSSSRNRGLDTDPTVSTGTPAAPDSTRSEELRSVELRPEETRPDGVWNELDGEAGTDHREHGREAGTDHREHDRRVATSTAICVDTDRDRVADYRSRQSQRRSTGSRSCGSHSRSLPRGREMRVPTEAVLLRGPRPSWLVTSIKTGRSGPGAPLTAGLPIDHGTCAEQTEGFKFLLFVCFVWINWTREHVVLVLLWGYPRLTSRFRRAGG